MFSSDRLKDTRNDVGELFVEASLVSVLLGNVETIPNLTWMIPMAMGADRACWPYRIRERDGGWV